MLDSWTIHRASQCHQTFKVYKAGRASSDVDLDAVGSWCQTIGSYDFDLRFDEAGQNVKILEDVFKAFRSYFWYLVKQPTSPCFLEPCI